MPQCEIGAEFRLILLLLSAGLGSLSCTVVALLFAWKWHYSMDENDKQKIIPRLSAVFLITASIERTLKIVGIVLQFYFDRLSYILFYQIHNMLCLLVIFGAIYSLLCIKLISSFKGSIHEISEYDRRVLYFLSIASLILITLFSVLNGIPATEQSTIGRLSMAVIVLFALIFAIMLFAKVDMGFARRLKALVATSSVDSVITSEDHRATVSNYDVTNQQLLKAIARSTLTALAITGGFLFTTLTGILFAIGSCDQYSIIIGHASVGLGFTIVGLAVCLSLPHFSDEYQHCCVKWDHYLQHIVAEQTNAQVTRLRTIASSDH